MPLPVLMQDIAFLVIVTLLVRPVGAYLWRVFTGQRTLLDRLFRPIERGIYAVSGVRADHGMTATEYALAFVLFGLVNTLLLYGILRLQWALPNANAAALSTPLTPDLSFNTALSFSTTTTWQAYAGETTMGYWTQLLGLAAQNFIAGAAGLAVGVAVIRGFARASTENLGNFWVDVTRGMLWVLLPLSLVGGLALVWQGVPMNFHPYVEVTTLDGGRQVIAQGPVAALEWIKNLGTNGGGFFNANGAHPYENPTPLTNLLEMLAIVVLPAALTYTFGRMIGRPRQGWALYGIMVTLFALGLALGSVAEQQNSPALDRLGVEQTVHEWQLTQPGGNMEGKEMRLGIAGSVLTAVTTSNGATGSTNSAHDSYTPLGGAVPVVNMLLGETLFGGLGTGLYSLLAVVLFAVFVAGLMVGRTPEYVGKRLTPVETRLLAIYILIGPAAVLLLTALAVVAPAGVAGLTTNSGPHGLTELLNAYTSSFSNNGQTFGGLSANSLFFNLTTAVAMLLGRFGLAIPALLLAGAFARQPIRGATVGTLPTDTPLFGGVVIGTLLIVGALTYLPALALGPIVEQLRWLVG
jgi:K+-transporting ATPase ATPase A chain